MPTPPQLLMQDHRKVEGLFEQYKKSADASVVKQICTELKVHTTVEEEVVYPVLGSDVPGGKQMKEHAEEEHQEVEQAIKEIIKLGYQGPQIDGLMQKVISGVTEHVQEEEGEVFPKMEEAIDSAKLERLGAELEKAKQANGSRMNRIISRAQDAGALRTDFRAEDLAIVFAAATATPDWRRASSKRLKAAESSASPWRSSSDTNARSGSLRATCSSSRTSTSSSRP